MRWGGSGVRFLIELNGCGRRDILPLEKISSLSYIDSVFPSLAWETGRDKGASKFTEVLGGDDFSKNRK